MGTYFKRTEYSQAHKPKHLLSAFKVYSVDGKEINEIYISSHCPKTRTSPDFKMFLVDQTHLKSDNIRKST